MLSKLRFGLGIFILLLLSTLSLNNNALVFQPLTLSPVKINGQVKTYSIPTYVTLGQKRYTPEGTNNFSGPYPVHNNITATYFYIGEPASADNDYIANNVSAWDSQWEMHFGGVDDPKKRNGYFPVSFTPKENPFYFALPYFEFNDNGLKPNSVGVYWYTSKLPSHSSLLKNRWIKITFGSRTAYAQWEDVGPNEDNDINYVFGTERPRNTFGAHAGLDVSPAVKDYLGGKDTMAVSWQFVDPSAVPEGPWKQIITTSQLNW